jgi:hypothetical protein
METIGHLGPHFQTAKRGNAAFPRLAVECGALPWVARGPEAGIWIPGFVATATAVPISGPQDANGESFSN